MNYNKQGAKKKQKKLVSKASKNKRKITVSLFKGFLVAIIAVLVIGIGAGLGAVKGILDNAPDIDSIDVNPDGYQTVVYNQNGEVVTTLSTINSNRVEATYEELPEDLINAFVAIEDERFWEHNGIDIRGIGRAFVKGVAAGGHFSEGASTITQQLIKNEVFNVGLDEDTFLDSVERKLQEQYLALELEKRMTKEEIITCYLNSIYLGQGVHGVKAAAETYFNKDLSELTVSECAVIAAITQNPSKYDPTAFPDKNAERRENVLDKMLELGYITQDEYDAALADDVYARIQLTHEEAQDSKEYNSYFIDAVINDLAEQLVEEKGYTESQAYNAIYSGGLQIYITQDAAIQSICDSVINDASNYPAGTQVALEYALTLIIDEETGETINYDSNKLLRYFKELTGNSKYNLIYSNEESARAAADQFRDAMIAETGGTFLAERFSTTVQPQASFVLMDQSTGYVKAIVGGRGEKTGNLTLNRATESTRQPGSTFKVLAAFVPALDTAGMSLATSYEDEPYSYTNGRPVKNWYSGYRGLSTIRSAIRDSMNIIAVRTITDVTPQVAYDYLINMGFTTLVESETASDGTIISDINQSLALGGLSNGVTNLEITGAYAAIANGGTYVEPILYTKVLDHDGNVLIDNTPETKQVMKETTAWLINNAMQDVVTSGTGTAARLSSGMAVSGKTGTTSSNYDFWFCGSTPYYTASIWMGYDVNTSFSGGSYHKRMWAKIMDQIVALEGQDTSATWPMPSGITRATVCLRSGMIPVEGTCTPITEYFAEGTILSEVFDSHNFVTLCWEIHMVATEFCPETVQYEYTIDEGGNITFLEADFEPADNILDTSCNVHVSPPVEEVSYTISSAVLGVGGTISNSTTVVAGQSAVFYITPSAGYAISDVKVDGISQGAISTFTFNNVFMNHTIEAVFTPISSVTPTTPTTPDTPSTESTVAPTTATQ